jgi:SAM-dependent methyltransferase
MIAEAEAKNIYRERLNFTVGNAEKQPFGNNTFDAVFNTISFLHYPNPEKVLGEVQRVLKPRGKFYLADYGKGEIFPCESLPLSPGGLHFYSRAERTEMGNQVGLELLAHHYLMFGILLTIWQKPCP